ncbi:outer membrane protein assembly factor BamB [Rappaport israeli]|uniref:outer membrane protein assembly factor BamB n=1 Tax=Rappaport israeli TaxID=1839807 RepID=UPI0009306A44|nr:outer membrane protein assembly factor BamB [Rappaport israeli]
MKNGSFFKLKNVGLCLASLMLTACSNSNFFLGKSNAPEPKPLPVLEHQAMQSQILWQQKVGKGAQVLGISLQPAAWGGRIYAVSADGYFAAFTPQTGQEIFSVNLQNEISAGVTLENGVAYVGTRKGDIMALDAENGRTLWRQALPSMALSAPVVADNIVVVRSNDGTVSAFNHEGEALWQYQLQTPLLSIRGTSKLVVGGGVVILTADNGFFVVLDQMNGLPITELRLASGQGNTAVERLVDMDATPIVNHQTLFGSAYQAMMFAINLSDGSPLWRQPQVSTQKNFALSTDKVFVVTDTDHVVALEQRNGNIIWENTALEGRKLSPVVAIPNAVGVLDAQGYLHWLNAQTGKVIGQTALGNYQANTQPLVLSEQIIWQMTNGQLFAIKPN